MAVKKETSALHFILRFLGVTGFFAAIVGLVLWLAIDVPEGKWVAAGGGAAVLLVLIIEIPSLLQGMMSRRGALGGSVLAQILLATILVAGINAFSFLHYKRFDLTQNEIFSLKQPLATDLARLKDDTTIIVFQRHTSFGEGADNRQDNYDAAAHRKIIEKIRDLAELFGDLGPRFSVEMLDIHDDDFEEKLRGYREKHEPLAKAIERAPENSIFIYAEVGAEGRRKKHFQQLSFNDIYQLDKKASAEAGNPNLVLIDQGLGAFVGKILNVQEKRPRIAVAVAHPFLGVDGHEQWSMKGLKQKLIARGFDCEDIILKNMVGDHQVLTRDENDYEKLERQLAGLKVAIEEARDKIDFWQEYERDFSTMRLADLQDKYWYVRRKRAALTAEGLVVGWQKPDFYNPEERKRILDPLDKGEDYQKLTFDESIAEEYLKTDVRPALKRRQKELEQLEGEQKEKEKQRAALNVENLRERKRIADLSAKFSRLLEEFDMLILPRITLLNSFQGDIVPFEIHELHRDQVAAVKEFLKAGKPVLVCEGPAYKMPRRDPRTGMRMGSIEPDNTGDGIDEVLREVGFVMPSQTIIFDAEIQELRGEVEEEMAMRKAVEPPPISFDPKLRPNLPEDFVEDPKKPNPIRASLEAAARSLSKEYKADLRPRQPRPVYPMKTKGHEGLDAATPLLLEPLFNGLSFSVGHALATSTMKNKRVVNEEQIFLLTDAACWNEDKPFLTAKGPPRYDPDEGTKKDKGTLTEMRRGPFPIGAAREPRLPDSWFKDGEGPVRARVAVIGDGNVVQGATMGPMREKMFVDLTNWLLARDELLSRSETAAQEGGRWSYPRVHMSDGLSTLWAWGMWLGLPLIFVYLGIAVMLVRRMR